LALGLGRTVGELECSLSPRELADWQAYYLLEPWGAWRDNYHAGLVAARLSNLFRGKKAKPVSPADFFYEYSAPQKSQTNCESFKVLLMALAKDKSHGRRSGKTGPPDGGADSPVSAGTGEIQGEAEPH
jgi:hypothetical protein